MKITRIFLGCLMLLVISVLASAQSSEAVIQRAIDSMGGKAAFDKISSMDMKISGTMMDSMQIEMQMRMEKPDKIRIDMSMMGMEIIMASDGKDYWMSQSGQVMDMPEMQKTGLSMNKNMFTGGGLLNLDEMGITTEYVGKENIDGVDAEVVKFTYTQSNTSGNWYFSSADGLPFMAKIQSPAGETEMRISVYKEYNGIKFATHIEATSPQGEMIFNIDEIKINEPIDASLFARP